MIESSLDPDLHETVEKIAISMAEEQVDSAPPNPFMNKEQEKIKNKEEIAAQFSRFLERLSKGINELTETLQNLSLEEPELLENGVKDEIGNLKNHFKTLIKNLEENKENDIKLSQPALNAMNKAASKLYESKDYPKSSAVYAALAFLCPAECAFWIGNGNSEYFNMNYDAAMRAYKMAAEIAPSDPTIHFYISHCYFMQNRPEKALASVEKSLEIIHEYPENIELEETAKNLRDYYKSKPVR